MAVLKELKVFFQFRVIPISPQVGKPQNGEPRVRRDPLPVDPVIVNREERNYATALQVHLRMDF